MPIKSFPPPIPLVFSGKEPLQTSWVGKHVLCGFPTNLTCCFFKVTSHRPFELPLCKICIYSMYIEHLHKYRDLGFYWYLIPICDFWLPVHIILCILNRYLLNVSTDPDSMSYTNTMTFLDLTDTTMTFPHFKIGAIIQDNIITSPVSKSPGWDVLWPEAKTL